MSMVCWAGNVGQDVQYREIDGIGGCASFSIAITARIRRDGEWVDGTTTWVRVTCWRLLAEHARDSVRKGDPVVVYGRLDTRRWTDDRGGIHDDLQLEATFLGHDLRRGVAQFRRTGRPAPEVSPRYETETDAELAVIEAAEEAALRDDALAAAS